MKKQPAPAIGDIWIKRAYKTVGYPAGRVAITDVVIIKDKTQITYQAISGANAGKVHRQELAAFLRMYIHGSSPTPELLAHPDDVAAQEALAFAEHTEAYRGDPEYVVDEEEDEATTRGLGRKP